MFNVGECSYDVRIMFNEYETFEERNFGIENEKRESVFV
jgi:hypothetical protein